MNVLVFLLISLIVHAIPIPFSTEYLRPNRLIKWLPFRLVWGTVAWVIICLIFAMTLPWAIITLIMSFAALMVVSSGFRPGGDIEQMLEGIRVPYACIGILILIILPGFSGIISWTSDVSNAEFFDSMITVTDDPLFENPIPDRMVRLVTEEYATFVAQQRLSAFGSNTAVAAAHITTRNGTLVWVCTIVSTNVLAENYVKGFIVVDANDPQSVAPYLINQTTIPVGEGLFWDKNIQFGNYLNDMTSAYQYAYPTWDPNGDLVYVQTRTPLGFDFVERATGPIVYWENGTVVQYTTIQDTPDWITQAYSEEWLEREVTRWGGYRRGDGFDLFAGGFLWFIPPSTDRLEIHEDTRYIINPDSSHVEAFIAVHPVAASTTLAGVFRATRTEVYYHDLSDQNFVSGSTAASAVIASIVPPASGFYYGAMPLLYPVVISPTETKWTWYTPIYWTDSTWDSDLEEYVTNNMRLHALGLVDASNVDRFSVEVAGGTLSGEELVYQVRRDYVELFGGTVEEPESDTFNMTANVVSKVSDIVDSNQHIILETDNTTIPYIEGARAWMNLTDWYTLLLDITTGNNFTATLQLVDGVYRILAIVKN
jgi:voltage-gated potassium channel Kch